MGACASSPKEPAEESTTGSAAPSKPVTKPAAPPARKQQGKQKPRREDVITDDPACNVTEDIYQRTGLALHLQPNHPIAIVKVAVYGFLDQTFPGLYAKFDELPIVVSTSANFEELRIPATGESAFYTSKAKSLRWHMLAHLRQLLQGSQPAWVASGDVFRRDKGEDAWQSAVFHQVDGVRVFVEKEWKVSRLTAQQHARLEVKTLMEDMSKALLGNVECRWADISSTYMEPAFNLQVFSNHSWVDIGSCGVLDQSILETSWRPPAQMHRNGTGNWSSAYVACSFSFILERLAMVMFGIPDIQLFWTEDPRFLNQFKAGDTASKFKPYDAATTAAVAALQTPQV